MFANALIYLFGFSGVGKLTIAKTIAEKLPCVIVDNQLINNPVFKVVEADGKTLLHSGVWREIRKIREAVYNALCYLAKPETNFILTNELLQEVPGDASLFAEVEAIAEVRGSAFIPVRLLCDREELLKRVQSPGRKEQCKLVDTENFLYKKGDYTVLKPKHKNLLELDVTSLTPEEAAKIIFTKLKETYDTEL